MSGAGEMAQQDGTLAALTQDPGCFQRLLRVSQPSATPFLGDPMPCFDPKVHVHAHGADTYIQARHHTNTNHF